MTSDEILAKMHDWIIAAQEKAKLPGQDPFSMTSLTYCARESVGVDAANSVRKVLWQSCEQMAQGKYDVFTPEDALGVIAWAIEDEDLSHLKTA